MMQARHLGGRDADRSLLRVWARAGFKLVSLVPLILGLMAIRADAGNLNREAVSKFFPDPYYIGERDAALPVWPLFRHNIPQSDDFLGYVFESIDLAPIAGYAGTPPNLLIAINPEGTFISVRVISHSEPIFKHGVSEESLEDFTDQYRGLTVKQNIKVAASNASAQAQQAGPNAVIDGVSRATVSVRIMNETVLAASLKVARAKLGLSPGRDPALAARLKPDDGTTLSAEALHAKGYVSKTTIDKADIEKTFGEAFPKDAETGAGTDPKATLTDVWLAYLTVPQIGRAILGKDQFDKLMREFHEGDHAILVASRGRYGFRGPEQRAGAVPDQLSITQDGLPINVSDAIAVTPLESEALPKGVTWTVLKVIAEAGLDASRPAQLFMRITRKNAEIYPRREMREFPAILQGPPEYFTIPEPPLEGWRAVWYEQRHKIALTLSALLVLAGALSFQKKLSARQGAFTVFRLAFLAVTLGGIGWWGQGQLSIHNILAVINAAKEKGSFSFLLFDPVSLFIWGFVLVSLMIFGRGTFCGWLCPFGALQEFSNVIARRLGIPQYTVPYAIDRKLRLLKYVVLAAIIGFAFVSLPVAEGVAEFEPFKTAITLGFDRAWPYALYAGAIVLLSSFLFKGFCLYLCPLGAALALLGRARRFDWIARRAECGTPCQLCTVRCRYGAIEPQGQVKYDECFQCLDCVAIYEDSKTCVAEVLARKGRSLAMPGQGKGPATVITRSKAGKTLTAESAT